MHWAGHWSSWKRVYAGQDLYEWLLRYRSDERAARPEKSR
jgi:hypothetical protein